MDPSNNPVYYLHDSVVCPACKTSFLISRPVPGTEPAEEGTIDEFWSVCDTCGILLRMDTVAGQRRAATQEEIDILEIRSPEFYRNLMDLRGDIELALHVKQALADLRSTKPKSKAQFV